MWILTSLMILILISGVDKGLEMSDEGNSLMLYKDPYLYGYYSSFNFLVAKLPSFFASDVWNLRAINIGLRVLSAGVLALGAWRWLNAAMSYRRSTGLLLCLCAVAIACNLVPSPLDKNVVSNSLISFAAGLLLFLLSLNNDLTENKNRARLLIVLVGALTGLAFFAHFTSAIIFYLLTIIVVSVLRNDRLPLLSLQALGLVLSLFVYFGCFEEFGFWYTTFKDQIGSEATGNHQFHTMAGVYWLNIQAVAMEFWLYFKILLPVVIVTTLIAIRTGTSQRTASRKFSIVVSGLVAVGFGLALFVSGGFLSPYMSYFLGLILMVIGLTVFFSMNKIVCSKLASGKPLLLAGGALLLAVLPFAAHFGTRNPILSHALLYQAPWVLFVSVMSLLLSRNFRYWPLPVYVMGAMTVCWMVQLVKYIDHPYKLDAGWTKHTEPAQVPRLVGLKFTPEANRFYSSAYQILQSSGFEKGDPVLAFYSLPGLVYAVGGTSVGRAWLSGIPGSAQIVCRSLQNLKARKMERLYFLSLMVRQRIQLIVSRTWESPFPMTVSSLGRCRIPTIDPVVLLISTNFGQITHCFKGLTKCSLWRWQAFDIGEEVGIHQRSFI